MMYHYLSLPLAIGITVLNTTSGVALEALKNSHSLQSTTNQNSLLATQPIAENNHATAQIERSSYLGLMNAGYNASQKQEYTTALNYFRQALTLQPGDSNAEKAIKNVSIYGFDLYMQAGYAADRVRDYTHALQHFQTALQIRPDSWYAKQAVSNVTGYLAQQPVEAESEKKGNRFSLLFMLVGIAVASALSVALLVYLFKKTDDSLQSHDSTELESIESDLSMVGASELDEEVLTANVNQREDLSPEESVSFSAPPETNSNNAHNNASLVSRHNSLAKLDIVPELIQDLSTSDRGLRRKTVWELAQRGDSRAMKPLVELMVEVDSQERGLILEAMTQIAGRTLKPMNKAIMMSLQDENTQVKQNAIRDLTRVYELMSQVTKRLSQAVEDSDAQVQETAKWALQKLNQMPATPVWGIENSAPEANDFHKNNSNTNGTNGTHKNPEQQYPYP